MVRRMIRALWRGLVMRCPACGGRGLGRSYFGIRERCPGCGLRLEREEGYWLGAVVVALVVTEMVFALWLVLGIVVTWPQVPWTLLLVVGVLLNVAIPVLGYPWARTAWMGLHHAFVPPDPAEQADAIAAHEAARRAADHAGGPMPPEQ